MNRIFQPLAWPLRHKLLAAALAALLPALVPISAALDAFDSLLDSQQSAEQAAARLHSAEETLRMLFDAQSAIRGFFLTGEPALLVPFEVVAREMPAKLAGLQAQAQNDGLQAWRVRRAIEIYNEWHDEVAAPTTRARTLVDGLPAEDPLRIAMLALIERRIELREGERLSEEFRWLITAFDATEIERLAAAQNFGAGKRATLFWLILAGVPAALATGTLAARLLARRATRSLSELARAATQIEQGELPEPIAYVGRDELTWLARAFNRMIAKEAVRRSERVALQQLDELLQSSASLAEAAGIVATFAPRMLGTASGGLYFYDASRCDLERAAAFGDAAAALAAHFAPDRCWAIRLARPHRAEAAHDPRCSHGVPARGASICIPLAAHGEVFGLLSCSLPDGEPDETADRLAAAEDLGERLALQFAALRLREDLRNQSIRDPLTGVFNRRYFDETFERELRRAERARQPLSLLLIDLDHFKRFNDTFGHEAGDLVLREFGALLSQVFRAGDLPCRLGGEEFAVLLPDSDIDGVRHRVEELSMRLRNRELRLRKQPLGRVTLSAGLAGFPRHGSTPQELLRAADEALYAAKHAGRDRYLIAS